MSLVAWNLRSVEEAAHFNPAYCGALLFEFAKEYEKYKGSGSDYTLLFCALAIAMHPKTRNQLPKSTAMSIYSWLESNSAAKIGFSARAINLRPYVQEAVRFSLARNAIAINDQGRIIVGPRKASFTPAFLAESTSEIRETVAAVKKVARWFAAAGETSGILAAWGVRS